MTTSNSSTSLGEQKVPTLGVEDAWRAMVDEELRPWLHRMQRHWRVGVTAFALLTVGMAMAASSLGGAGGLGTGMWLGIGTPVAALLAGMTVAARALIDDGGEVATGAQVSVDAVGARPSCAGVEA